MGGAASGGAGRFEETIRLADAEVVEKNAVELVIVVLAGMHQRVLAMRVQRGHHPRQADDLRARSDDGGDFQLACVHG